MAASNLGWIGVDLDGTLAHFEPGDEISTIGAPIPTMVRRVIEWLAMGFTVKIVTARVAGSGKHNGDGILDSNEFADLQQELIGNWTERHVGKRLEATATKDFQMIRLYDDRAVQVITNQGLLVEVH